MKPISEIWRIRFVLIALVFLSLVPVLLQQMLNASEIYEIRLLGGLHPADLLGLQKIGQFSFLCPAIFSSVLVVSSIRSNPPLTRMLLAFSLALFVLYLLLFLYQTVLVIQLHVPEHKF